MENKVKTKLYEAYAKRVSKSDEKLSVSVLCEKADVSRASFYIHFKDIEDFEDKCRDYIIDKLFEQIFTFMKLRVNPYACDMIFSSSDINMLKYFTNRHTYWDFAEKANVIIGDKFKTLMISRWGEEYYENNKDVFEFALNGSVATLYFDLLNYDEETFKRNMGYIANIVRELFHLDK